MRVSPCAGGRHEVTDGREAPLDAHDFDEPDRGAPGPLECPIKLSVRLLNLDCRLRIRLRFAAARARSSEDREYRGIGVGERSR